MQEYVTIYAPAEDEFVERKSRFIGAIAPVQTEEEAQAWIAQVRQQHRDATHNTYAYILRNGIKRYSDDGEPQGTAGVPMLDCIEKEGLVDVAVVVTRYFGGIKLGTGGLVRAYQGMVKLGLETLPTREHMIPARVEVVLDYPHITVFRRLLPDYRATVASENFGVDATYELLLPDQNIPALETALTELTDGAVLITRLDDGTMPPETP